MRSFNKKSLALVLSAACLLSAFTTQAAPGRHNQNRCLEQASDSEILNELSYRLKTSVRDPNVGNFLQHSTSCNSSGNLQVMTTNLSTGSSALDTVEIYNSSLCASLSKSISTKVAQNRPGAIISAGCNSSGNLVKVILLNGAIKKEIIEFYNSSQCNDQARNLNQ